MALPVVDRSVVGLQGTSLGGFVAATVAGLDHGYDRVFILLAGGNLQEVLFNGSKEVERARKKLAAAGVTDKQIKEFAARVEPLRLAHRIHPEETWLYSGQLDKVVPPRNSLALAKAAIFLKGITLSLLRTTTWGSFICRRRLGNYETDGGAGGTAWVKRLTLLSGRVQYWALICNSAAEHNR